MSRGPTSAPVVAIMGASRGPVSRLAPRTRIIAGTLAALSCAACDATTPAGLVLVLLTVLVWLAAAAAPVRLVARLTLLGAVMLAPFLALTPFVHPTVDGPGPAWVTFAVFSKGLATLLVATVTLSTLTLARMHEGLGTLPLPSLLVAIVVQIFLQAGLLGRETARMVRALSVRRAVEGTAHGIVTLAGVSAMWMQRLLGKVEKVGAAMELRGFDGTRPPLEVRAAGPRDGVALLLAGAWLVALVVVRAGGLP